MKTRQQIIQETILDILQDKQELNEFNAKRAAGLGALGLSIATAGQFAGSHVTPIQDYRTTTSSYTMPVDSNTFKAGLERHGLGDVAQNTGNFEPHSKITTIRRMRGVQKGEQMGHAVRGPLDVGSRIVQGAAKEELPTQQTMHIQRFSPTRGIETYRKEHGFYSDNREFTKREGSISSSDRGADFLNLNISSQGRVTDYSGNVKSPTPSIAGQSAVAGGLYGAGMLALGALRRRRSK